MLNTQKKEKPLINIDDQVQVHSIFSTIQGEGPFAGVPAIFIRLAGCNLDCPWCDTIYTGDDVRTWTPDDVVGQVVKMSYTKTKPTKLVVITGGEPFRQDFGKLVLKLHHAGYTIQIETNGTLYQENFPYHLTTVVCSPKIAKIHKKLIPFIKHYKYVAEHNSISLADGLPIEVLGNNVRKSVARPPENMPYTVYLQAMDCQDEAGNKKNLDAVVASCQEFGYTLCIQVHKLIGVE